VSKPIAYTPGEPAGIGADIIIQLLQQQALPGIVYVGDRTALNTRARQLGLDLGIIDYPATADRIQQLAVKHVALVKPDVCGKADPANVSGVIEMLESAIDSCLSGEFSAMVTGPVHKGVINDGGVSFSGHTEFIAQRTKAAQPVMLLASATLRVALVTTHLPLREVSDAITQQAIERVCRVLDAELRHKFAIASPRILVCGLNPHAGEQGHLGSEELDTIRPALNALQGQGIDVVGPLPADTVFTPKYLRDADVVLAMYHDQGLPVLKSQSFGQAANITLGLPIIRTSVDHGTAFDLAGSGKTDAGSLQTALALAETMVATGSG